MLFDKNDVEKNVLFLFNKLKKKTLGQPTILFNKFNIENIVLF